MNPARAPAAPPAIGVLLVEDHPATREGLRRSATADTLWKGQAALLIEVVDVEDPLTIKEEETYTISVKNLSLIHISEPTRPY